MLLEETVLMGVERLLFRLLLSTHGIPFTRVCGKLISIQKGAQDGFINHYIITISIVLPQKIFSCSWYA